MKEQHAIHLLRTKQPGDTKDMELAKLMGAEALEHRQLRFIMPVCEACGNYIQGVSIESVLCDLPACAPIPIKYVEPTHCPHCGAEFIHIELNFAEQTAILVGRMGEGQT